MRKSRKDTDSFILLQITRLLPRQGQYYSLIRSDVYMRVYMESGKGMPSQIRLRLPQKQNMHEQKDITG